MAVNKKLKKIFIIIGVIMLLIFIKIRHDDRNYYDGVYNYISQNKYYYDYCFIIEESKFGDYFNKFQKINKKTDLDWLYKEFGAPWKIQKNEGSETRFTYYYILGLWKAEPIYFSMNKYMKFEISEGKVFSKECNFHFLNSFKMENYIIFTENDELKKISEKINFLKNNKYYEEDIKKIFGPPDESLNRLTPLTYMIVKSLKYNLYKYEDYKAGININDNLEFFFDKNGKLINIFIRNHQLVEMLNHETKLRLKKIFEAE